MADGTGQTLKLPADLLKPDPRNAREIQDGALDGLNVSVETFGDLSGITWNERTGNLVCGHQRMKVLRKAGAVSWTRHGDRGEIVHPKTGERFTVRVVSWDETTERMANLTANNPAIQGEFTKDALEQLRELEDQMGFAALGLDDLRRELEASLQDAEDAAPKDGKTDPDDAVEPPATPISKTGDLWELGAHRLLCGDSTSAADVARLMGGKKAALMNTDPPYGVDYVATKKAVRGMKAVGRFQDIANDSLKPEALGEFLEKVFAAAAPVLAADAAWYVWHPPGELNEVFRRALTGAGVLVHRQIIWVKPRFVLTRSGMYHWRHEPCFYGWRKGNEPPWYGEKNQSSVWELGRDDGKAVHPTQKPVALFEGPMGNHTRKGDVCFEPFSGSGSQIIAGERLGRRVFAMEMSPGYVDAAVARWEAFTGKKARRAKGK